MNCSNCAGEKVASGVIMASKMGNAEGGNHMIGVPFFVCRKCGHLSVNLSRSALETVDVWQIPSQGKEANMAQNPERKRETVMNRYKKVLIGLLCFQAMMRGVFVIVKDMSFAESIVVVVVASICMSTVYNWLTREAGH